MELECISEEEAKAVPVENYSGIFAQCYVRILESVMKNIFGIDIDSTKTKRGIFGKVSVWVGVTETQSKDVSFNDLPPFKRQLT